MNWGAYKTRLRRSVLNDESSASWSDAVLLDVLENALATFAMHTAQEATVTYSITGDVLDIPSDVVGRLEEGSLFKMTDASGVRYLKPYTMATGTEITYRTWSNKIYLPPSLLGSLEVQYYSYWPLPDDDTDEMVLPTWSYAPLAYLIAAIALTPVGIQSANIRQWEETKPEQNALRVHQKHLLDLYDREIQRFPRQDRLNGFMWLYE